MWYSYMNRIGLIDVWDAQAQSIYIYAIDRPSIYLSIYCCNVRRKAVRMCNGMILRRSSSHCTCQGLIRVISDTCVGVQRLLISKPAAAAVHSDAAAQNSTVRPPPSNPLRR